MKAMRFDVARDYEEICRWARERQTGEPPLDLLPETGFIVPGTCVFFLYKTDSKIGFAENLLSSPLAFGPQLSEAIEACVQAVEAEAQRAGITALWSHSFIPGIIDRAKDLGYSVGSERYKVMTKRIA